MRWIFALIFFVTLGIFIPISREGQAADFVVYSVYQSLNLGNKDETTKKDFYVNMGAAQGIHEGSVLQVLRRISTYDEMSRQFYRDMVFPIAQIKVIHVEQNAAVARLDKMLPLDQTPVVNPQFVMVGDLVQVAEAVPESK